ncbi:MAG: LysR family transcriptional regulator [Clostridia bacterium]|nr:LysR family transcriptional regulator [Clostridia bacterium]
MNILHLKYALEVAKAGSINKAAENLLMGQPNLSRAIKELEASFSIAIFDRSAKGMVVTPEGEAFLAQAERLLGEIQDFELTYTTGSPVKQKFSVSVPRASYISEAFTRFTGKLTENPAEIYYQEANTLATLENLLHNNCHLGILRYAVVYDRYFQTMLAEKSLTHEVIADFTPVLLMSKSSPLARRDELALADLKPLIEIACPDPYVPSLPTADVKKEELTSPTDRRVYVFERASQFALLAKNNQTFLWSSPVSTELLNQYALVQKPCHQNTRRYKDILIYRKDYRLSELDRAFLTELCNTKREWF